MSKANPNATIVDIARRARVTNITVSRAFNKPELVKPETRERIHAIAKELNYVPNAFAQGLNRNAAIQPPACAFGFNAVPSLSR